ncbi:hypothetical protein ACFZBU_38360 [Embleya sp. NPDC008237]|uniref:hypothetical protein n=1 Tax=Embleya sp. NPDC008237 TaxID=3363978 RepID=UPI0036F10077
MVITRNIGTISLEWTSPTIIRESVIRRAGGNHVADGDLAGGTAVVAAFAVALAGLERDHLFEMAEFVQEQLILALQGAHPLARGDLTGRRAQEGGLADTLGAADDHVLLGANQRAQEPRQDGFEGAPRDQIVEGDGP